MAWTYTTGVLTSTGATEASPDSLLAGVLISNNINIKICQQ